MLRCGSSSPSHWHIPLCSERYAPFVVFLSFHCHLDPDSTHCSLYALGCFSSMSSGSWNKANASCGTAWSPWLNMVCTWSLILLFKTSLQYLENWWRASLQWSHNSYKMFHNFFISFTVHCLLDFHLFHWAQYASCCALHSSPNHPSRAESQPTINCCLVTIKLVSSGVPLCHACKPIVSNWIDCGSDCSCFIHSWTVILIPLDLCCFVVAVDNMCFILLCHATSSAMVGGAMFWPYHFFHGKNGQTFA